MLSVIPYPRLLLKQLTQQEIGINGRMRRFQHALHIHRYLLVLVRIDKHQAKKVVAIQDNVCLVSLRLRRTRSQTEASESFGMGGEEKCKDD